MSEFFVGQRVVKIKYNIPRIPGEAVMPNLTLGAIYTIREIDCRALNLGLHEVATFRIEEVTVPQKMTTIGLWEDGYHPAAFRPLEYKAMSIFRAIAANPKIEIREDA